jgi:hypothetical protein
MQSQDPARMACCQDILAIPAKKHDRPTVAHLSVEQTRELLALPDRSTRNGRRDATLLATLYNTAARVQELADLTVRDIRLDGPAMAALTGKGRKTRHVPIDGNTTALLTAYLAERQLNSPGQDDHPVFFNQHRSKLSRGGIAWILRKYQAQAADPALANARLSPHILRHSRAMHLYDCGVPLPYIRDILGHKSLEMTMVYARIADRTVAEEYFRVTEKVEALYNGDVVALPAEDEGKEMRKLRAEMHRRMLGNGYCARPVELDCHFESICESCTFFVTTIEFRPTLQAQRDDAANKGQLGRQKIFDGLLQRLDQTGT